MFVHPLDNYIVTRDFYYKSDIYVGGQHAATDYIPRVGPATGAPIRVIADGVVVGNGWDTYSGFFIAVDHAGGWRSTYRHLYGQTPVSVGQRVVQGQIIGNVGNTGWSLGAHLHLDLWNRNKVWVGAFYKNGWWAVDPELYLDIAQQEEEDDMQLFIRRPGGAIALVGQFGKRPLTPVEWKLWEKKGNVFIQLSADDYDHIPDAGVNSDRAWLGAQLNWMWRHIIGELKGQVVVIGWSSADLARIAKAAADEQARRMQE